MANSIEERYTEFSFKGLEYSFAFDPMTDNPKEGATLRSVCDQSDLALAPSKFADNEAWDIANKNLGLK